MTTISIIILLSGLITFIWTACVVYRAKFRSSSNLEIYACLLLISVLGAIFCLVKIGQVIIHSDLTGQMDEFSEIILTVFILNLAFIFSQISVISKKKAIFDSRSRASIIMLILFLQFIFIGSFWSMFYFYKQAENVSTEQAGQYLNAVASSRASHISSLAGFMKELSNPDLDPNIENYVQNLEAGSKNFTSNELNDLLQKRMAPREDIFYLMAIVDQKGQVIGSTDNKIIREDWSDRKSFINRTKQGYFSDIFLDEEYNQNAVEISSPIIFDNVFLGVQVVRAKAESFDNVLQDRTNLGDTGESFLVNGNKGGELMTPRRFDNQIFVSLNGQPDADACVSDFKNFTQESPSGLQVAPHETPILNFANKFGREIFGTRAIVAGSNKADWCVIVEMGQNELKNPLQTQLLKAAIAVIVVLIVITILFLWVFDFFFRKL